MRRWGEGRQHYAPQDPEDMGARILAGEVDTALDRRLIRRFGLVGRALEKIDEGICGFCHASGEWIPRGRLEAVPEAFCTKEAQRVLET